MHHRAVRHLFLTRLCQSNFKVGKRKPFVDADGILHWPVLFVYPESMQQDIIEDVSETDLVSELLDVVKPNTDRSLVTQHLQMFSSEAPPLPWDTAREYKRDTVDVYYLANAGEPFSQVWNCSAICLFYWSMCDTRERWSVC